MTRAMGIGIGANSLRVAWDDRPECTRIPAALYFPPDAPPVLGAMASEAAKANAGTMFEGFVARAGDPVPLVADRLRRTGADLIATAVDVLVRDRAADTAEVAVAYPTMWTDFAVGEVATALARNGIRPTLVSAAEAAHVALLTARRIPAQASVLLVDVGSVGTDVALTHGAADGTVRVFRPSRSTEFGGDLIDALLVDRVLADISAANPGFDAGERWNWDGIRSLRAHVRRAKEQLSQDVSAVVEVNLLGIRETRRIVRGELEALIAAPVERVAGQVADAASAAAAAGREVDAVVLIGGGSVVPLLWERLSAQLRLPIVGCPDPANVTAHGAAIIASRVAATRRPATPSQGRRAAVSPAASRVRPPGELVPARRQSAPPRLVSRQSGPLRPVSPQSAPLSVVAGQPAPPRRKRNSPVAWALAAVVALVVLAGGGLAATELDRGQSTPTHPTVSHVVDDSRR